MVLRLQLTYRVNMTQIQVGSAERRLAQWVLYAVLAAPIVATLLHDLGVGAVAPWILYATIAVPMIAMRDALVTGFEPLIEILALPDPDDRHVLAAAIRGHADLIVTTNQRDFPFDVLGRL